MPPHLLYLHGFASSPASKKAVAFAARFPTSRRLDLRVPSFEHLRLSAMIATVKAAIGGADDEAVLVGSSLGGLTAARVAERDSRVIALVLLAPAFQLAHRWREVLGDELTAWRATGWREVYDYSTGAPADLDIGFLDDVIAVDGDDGTSFPSVTVPTLVFHGVQDDVVPVDHARRFAAGRAHVELVELDDGHELVTSLPRILERTARFLAPHFGA